MQFAPFEPQATFAASPSAKYTEPTPPVPTKKPRKRKSAANINGEVAAPKKRSKTSVGTEAPSSVAEEPAAPITQEEHTNEGLTTPPASD